MSTDTEKRLVQNLKSRFNAKPLERKKIIKRKLKNGKTSYSYGGIKQDPIVIELQNYVANKRKIFEEYVKEHPELTGDDLRRRRNSMIGTYNGYMKKYGVELQKKHNKQVKEILKYYYQLMGNSNSTVLARTNYSVISYFVSYYVFDYLGDGIYRPLYVKGLPYYLHILDAVFANANDKFLGFHRYVDYEYASYKVQQLGLLSKHGYFNWIDRYKPVGFPKRPEIVYGDKWVNWAVFLGIERKEEQMNHIESAVPKDVDLENMDFENYSLWLAEHGSDAEKFLATDHDKFSLSGLPFWYYLGSIKGEKLTKENTSKFIFNFKNGLTYSYFKELVREMGIKNMLEYKKKWLRGELPDGMPYNPVFYFRYIGTHGEGSYRHEVSVKDIFGYKRKQKRLEQFKKEQESKETMLVVYSKDNILYFKKYNNTRAYIKGTVEDNIKNEGWQIYRIYDLNDRNDEISWNRMIETFKVEHGLTINFDKEEKIWYLDNVQATNIIIMELDIVLLRVEHDLFGNQT